MRKPMHRDEARTRFRAFLAGQPEIGPDVDVSDSSVTVTFGDTEWIDDYVPVESVWATECRVYIRQDHWEPRNGPFATVEVNWSGTGRTVAQAAVAIENYQRAVALAARIEAFVATRLDNVESYDEERDRLRAEKEVADAEVL